MALTLDTRPRFARLTLRTDCPRCGANLPVNGPADEVECAECGHRQVVDPGLVRWLLNASEQSFPEPVRTSRADGDLTWRVTAEPFAAPPCPACEEGTLVPAGGVAACDRCGATAGRARIPAAWDGACDGLWIPTETDGARESAPIALNCPSCGAGLSVGADAPRLTGCDHCGSSVHLPDVVWRRFHPKTTVRPWVAEFDRDSPGALARREVDRKQREWSEAEAARKERDAQDAEERERRRALARERDAAAEREARERKAQQDAQTAEEQRRWSLLTAPLVLISLLLAVSAVGAMVLAGSVDVWHALTPRWKPWREVGLAAEALPEVAAAYAIGVWLACSVLAAIRGRQGAGVLIWCAIMLALSHIPVVGPLIGLYFAWEHLRDREPTAAHDVVLPRFTGLPLAILFVAIPIWDHLLAIFFLD